MAVIIIIIGNQGSPKNSPAITKILQVKIMYTDDRHNDRVLKQDFFFQ